MLLGCWRLSLGLLLGLLGQQDGLDIRQDTTLCNGHPGEKFVQLLVVADGQLQVTGDDSGLFVVASGVSCQLEDFGGQVFHYRSEIDGGTGTDALGVVTLPEQTVDATDWELQSGAARAGLCLSLNLSSFATARHVVVVVAR